MPVLKEIAHDEKVFADFSGVDVLSPSWADEFLTPLHKKFGNRFILGQSGNRSVITTVEMIEKTNNISFSRDKTSPAS